MAYTANRCYGTLTTVRCQVDFSHYSDDTVQMAVDLVNTRDVIGGDDRLTDPAGLDAFLADHAPGWRGAAAGSSKEDVDEVRALRERLRDVFLSRGEDEAAERLNAILAEAAATPRVSVHGGSPHLHFEPLDMCVCDWLGASTAMALATVLVDFGLDRFGVCSSDTCQDVFIDTSRNKSRRHCSTTCTTRDNVAAYRRRQAASPAEGR